MSAFEQGGHGWLQERCGMITASRFKDILPGKRGGYLQARETYLYEVLTERLTGLPTETPTTYAMRWGTEQEPYARAEYCRVTDSEVTETGFMQITDYCGASPDGLVESFDGDGCLEIKCPCNPSVHTKTLVNGMPDYHTAQVQGVMWATDTPWCDFVSYQPKFSLRYQLFIQRIYRDDDYIKTLAAETEKLHGEIEGLKL